MVVRAGEAAQGVARSGFPRTAAAQISVSGCGCLSVLLACSRALMRFLATAVLCRKRWLSLPVSTMWQARPSLFLTLRLTGQSTKSMVAGSQEVLASRTRFRLTVRLLQLAISQSVRLYRHVVFPIGDLQ